MITQAEVISHKVELHEMTESVKPRRRYQSPRRAAQAEQTRRDIVTAAGLLFRERGYCVPLADIASEAGVVVETVYRIFGTKAALFAAAVEALLAGGASRAEIPVGERPAIRAIREEPDPRKQVAGYAATQPGIHRRAGPLLRALRDARASDAELQRIWDEMEAWRLEGQGRFVALLAERGALTPTSRSTSRSTSRGRCARLPSTTCWSSIGAGQTSGIKPGSPTPSSGS